MKVFLAPGATGGLQSLKPYLDGLAALGVEAQPVTLPAGNAERAISVYLQQSGTGRVVVGGRSYGSRVASLAAASSENDFVGLLLFAYPLHRPGFPDQLRTEHWPRIKCPTLFLSGDRDPFANIDLLRQKIELIPDARLEVFKGQGHGLLAVLDQALDIASDFIKSEITEGGAGGRALRDHPRERGRT